MRRWITAETFGKGGRMALGQRPVELPADAVVSITLATNLSLRQFVMGALVSQLIMRQCRKAPGLLYAEVAADYDGRYSYTLSLWRGPEMRAFRDKRSHGWAMRKMAWLFYGEAAEAWFLTYRTDTLPAFREAMETARRHGRHFKAGMQVRPQSPPVRA